MNDQARPRKFRGSSSTNDLRATFGFRVSTLAAVIAITGACATPSQPALPAATSQESSAVPSVAVAPAATPELVTPDPTPAAAKVETTKVVLRLSEQFGYTEFNIVVEVTNTGAGWADVTTSKQSYTLSAKNGDLIEQGDFLYVFPTEIGPGEKAYYLAGVSVQGSPKKFTGATVDTSVDYEEIDGPSGDLPTFSTSNIKVSTGSFDNAIKVTGKVKNTSSVEAASAMVGVLLLGDGDKIIGGLVDNVNVNSLRPDQTKGFDTSYPTIVVKRSSIKKVRAIPFEFSFF